MIDPTFDPYQELIDLRIEFAVMTQNFQGLVDAHNRVNHLVANQTREQLKQLKFIQQQQQLIAELSHQVEQLTTSK